MGKARKMILWAMAMVLIVPLCFGMSGAKAATTYDVTQYGVATGNDAKTNRKALQQLLDKAKSGETIELTFPAGTFQIDETLMVYSNTTMTLNSGTTIKMTQEGQGMVQNGAPDGGAPGGYNRTSNVTINGGTWDGNSLSGTEKGTLIYFVHAKNINLKNMVLKNTCGNHFIEFAAVSSSSITGCTLKDFVKAKGIDYSSDAVSDSKNEASVTSEAIQLDFALADSSPWAEPFDGTACSGITVSGCTFTNCLSGVGNHHTDKTSTGITISNNTFTNMEKTCLNLYAMSGVTVSGNTATSGNRQFAVLHKTSGTVGISRNKMSGNGNAYGVDIVDCGGTVIATENTTVSGFISGFSIYNSTATISGNNITDSVKEAVLIKENSNVTVNGNNISGCGDIAIYADKSTADINSNQIKGGNKAGISMTDCSSSSITGNTVDYASSLANIYVDHSGADIKNNTVSGSTNYNIQTYNSCTGVISGNTYDIPYGIRNDGGMTREPNANTYKGHDKEPTAFTIMYHKNDDAAASEITTTVEFGTETFYLKPDELGFSGSGRFLGWKAYRNDFKRWRVLPAGSSDPIWADEVPAGGKYYLYGEVGIVAKTAEPGATLHFYAQWDTESGLVVPQYVREIEEGAFENIAASSAYVYDKCSKIGAGAFSKCKNLKTIRLPKDCEIGDGCFNGSPLTTITGPAGGTTQAWAEANGYTFKPEN